MTNREKAQVYHAAVSNYDESTIVKMVDENYIQHNPFVPTGRAAFVSFLPKLKQHGSRIENVRMLQDGPFIAMHHVWKNATPFGKDEMAAFHIIRFDSSGLIAEHWNVMTELVSSTLVDGETAIRDLEETARNKAVVAELFEVWMHRDLGDLKHLLPRYFHADCRHHGAKPVTEYGKQHIVLGEGNFVLSISEGVNVENPVACYDLFRMDNGKIAEHWNIYQDIPKENLANKNTMFNFG